VAPDYHVEVAGHFYSVPSRMIRQVVEVRATEATIEVFHRGSRIASHARSGVKRRHTTIPEHMPSAHRRYACWTPARLLAAAEKRISLQLWQPLAGDRSGGHRAPRVFLGALHRILHVECVAALE
jgi:transposase